MISKLSKHYKILVPARLNSKRLKNKLLIKVNGKPIFIHTLERIVKIFNKKNVTLLTDSNKILEIANEYGFNSEITSKKCKTGMDRLADYAINDSANYYINIQADEPLLSKKNLAVIKKFLDLNYYYNFNCYAQVTDKFEINSNSIPKAVISNNHHLIYMSRQPIPSNKFGESNQVNKQMCIYGINREDLLKFYGVSSKKSYNEKIEDIEILRLIDNEIKIKMIKLKNDSFAIDTLDDLNKFIKISKK